MNISNILKKVSFGCGLATLCVALQASAAFCGDTCCPDPCCPAPCCEDGPLSCNAFGVQIKGGVTPSWFEDRGRNYALIPGLLDPIVPFGGTQFDKIFDTPWQVGAELAWNASTHVQFFAEYVYFQAQGKKHRLLFDTDATEFSYRSRKLETNAFYLGARYFFGNIWCSECGMGSIAPFIGFKGGLVWRNNTKTRLDDTFVDLDIGRGNKNNRAALSAGLQVGLDWSINCNWGVVLTVEGVGTERFAGRRDVSVLNPVPGGVTELHFGDRGKLISVPVTLGVRYTF